LSLFITNRFPGYLFQAFKAAQVFNPMLFITTKTGTIFAVTELTTPA